jgi:branched-chain amino acid transport system permease protein
MAYVVDVITLAAILVIATHGYMLIKGLGGMLHLGHAVFYGIGAYAAAIASTKLLPAGAFPISVAIGGVAGMLGGLLVAWPGLRNRGRYFMIVTFAVQLIFATFVINLHFTGGPDGISSIPGISLGTWQPTSHATIAVGPLTLTYAQMKLAIMCGFAVLSFILCRRLILSPYGRLVRAVREDELVVEAYGREATPVKTSILMIGAGVTGIAGALFAHHFNYVGPTQFELDATILFLIMLIVGGQYSLVGATLGAVLMVLLLEVLRFLLDNVLAVPFEMTAHLRQVVFAVTLIFVLAWRSSGLVRETLPINRRPATPAGKSAASGDRLPSVSIASAAANTPAEHTKPDPVLICQGLSKSFGGVIAVADARLTLRPGRIVAIIGPNGAGKTSAFNILSGFEKADGGEALLQGVPILQRSTAEIARLGLARTFQDVRVWSRLSVIENLLVVLQGPSGLSSQWPASWPQLSTSVLPAHAARAWSLLDRFGLADHANTPAHQLSYAQRKMLSLARITCFDPAVMLLDEPTSGVDPRRLDTFLTQIKTFSATDGKAVCVIEHNMEVVRAIADEVVFMNDGRVVASGTPAEVLGDRQLMGVYLGHRELKAA